MATTNETRYWLCSKCPGVHFHVAVPVEMNWTWECPVCANPMEPIIPVPLATYQRLMALREAVESETLANNAYETGMSVDDYRAALRSRMEEAK